MENVIYKSGNYRITEILDEGYDMEELKGDCFDPSANPDIDPNTLKKQEIAFEAEVHAMGVYAYVLEKWNPEVGCEWEHIDSCYGFIGAYDPKTNYHDIVEEFKEHIARITACD